MAIRAFRVRLEGKDTQDLLVSVRVERMMTMSEFVRIQNALFAGFKRKGKVVKIDFLGCFHETMVWKEEDLLGCPGKKRKPRRKKAKRAIRPLCGLRLFGGTPCLCSEEL